MAEYIAIKRPNGLVTMVRSKIESASEGPLTEHEQIINELYTDRQEVIWGEPLRPIKPKFYEDNLKFKP